eukprot:423866-Pelagomonas_calceolata.AAC.2
MLWVYVSPGQPEYRSAGLTKTYPEIHAALNQDLCWLKLSTQPMAKASCNPSMRAAISGLSSFILFLYSVLTALDDVPNAQQIAAAICIKARINMNDLEGVFCEQIIHAGRSLDNLTPQEAHASSRFTRSHHTHFGVPLGTVPVWWGHKKRNKKPVVPLTFTYDNTFLTNYYAVSHVYAFPVLTIEWISGSRPTASRKQVLV